MKKAGFYLALIMMLCLMVCSCTHAEQTEVVEHQQLDADFHKDPEIVLTVAVQNGLSKSALAGLDCFVEKVFELSGGKMAVKKEFCNDLLERLDGGSELAFGSNEEFSRANGDFAIFSSPFYFTDYNHLTMTLNSPQFYEAIENTNISLMNAMPIGAFYDGNRYILSSREEMYDTIDQYNGRTMNILENQPAFEEILENFGSSVRERDEEYMLSNFGKNRNIAAMECEILLLGDITKQEKVESFHICKSFHRAYINWMMLSQTAKEALSDYEQAVITEAIAYAIAKNDNILLTAEEKSLEEAIEMGGVITAPNYSDFSYEAARVLRNSVKNGSIWDWQLYDEVQGLAFGN